MQTRLLKENLSSNKTELSLHLQLSYVLVVTNTIMHEKSAYCSHKVTNCSNNDKYLR